MDKKITQDPIGRFPKLEPKNKRFFRHILVLKKVIQLTFFSFKNVDKKSKLVTDPKIDRTESSTPGKQRSGPGFDHCFRSRVLPINESNSKQNIKNNSNQKNKFKIKPKTKKTDI